MPSVKNLSVSSSKSKPFTIYTENRNPYRSRRCRDTNPNVSSASTPFTIYVGDQSSRSKTGSRDINPSGPPRSTPFTIYTENLGSKASSSSRAYSEQESQSTSQPTAIRGKKQGLSLRSANLENIDMKSRKRSASKSKNMSQSKHADIQYVERTVSAQAASRWKPLAKVTKQFVLATLDDSIVNVLNETNQEVYEDVQDTLNILRQRIVGSMSALSGPPARMPSQYKQLEDHKHTLELAVAEATKQVETLEEEIGEQERLVEDKERTLAELKAASDKTVGRRRKLHPVMQSNNKLVLGLPELKGTRAGLREVKTSSKSSINPHREQCTDLLKKWLAEDSVKNIETFMESLTDE